MVPEYLKKLGFTEKEQVLYLALAELGPQPASVLAKKCRLDRVTAYKNLKRLAEKGFIKVYYEHSIQYFGIQSFDTIKTSLEEKASLFQGLLSEFPLIENLLRSTQKEHDLVPKLEVFEGEAGIKHLFRDLLFEISSQKILQVRMLTSNTFSERLSEVSLSRFVEEFFSEIEKRSIDLEILEASGMLIPESIHHIRFEEFDPQKVPAAKGTTNLFLAGHAVYVTCYKSSQIGLKIRHSEISQMFHFLFDMLKRMA